MRLKRPAQFLVFLVGLSASMWAVRADDGRSARRVPPTLLNDDLPRKVSEGKILSLAVLKEQVLGKIPGELIDVRAEREYGRILYVFKVLRKGGKVSEVEVDAATGEIVEVENE